MRVSSTYFDVVFDATFFMFCFIYIARLVTEHLEALIDCIKELSAENKKLHEEYEKVSIQTCRVKNKFMDYTKKRTSDLVKTLILIEHIM